jgi:hypothetical protein
MIETAFGMHDGKSWEALCQIVFKAKHGADGYQAVVASPGDYGLEGFTLHSSRAFQCYCPEKLYSTKDLNTKIQNKVRDDLGKLQKNAAEIQSILGATQIREWVLVTPHIPSKNALAQARKHEATVRGWGLPFIHPNFTVLLHDGAFYTSEIAAAQQLNSVAIPLDATAPHVSALHVDTNDVVYEANIRRKTALRLSHRAPGLARSEAENALHEQTLGEFLRVDAHLRRISTIAPVLYQDLLRLLNEFQNHVVEVSQTQMGSPHELTTQLRTDLEQRISAVLGPTFGMEAPLMIARDMIARWLAVCSLDYV